MKPRLLDLYCGAGGASKGYADAGFEVVGIDIAAQPNYPFVFHRLDVVRNLAFHRRDGWIADVDPDFRLYFGWFDAVHASPPCQAFTVYGNNRKHVRQDHPNLIPETRALLQRAGVPYVIENVQGAKEQLIDPIKLCGTSFGIEVRRHRLFESSIPLQAPPCDHGRFTERKYPGSSNRPNGRTVCNVGEYRVPLAVQKKAMQIDWMTLPELAQSIPPVYTQTIGRQLREYIDERRLAWAS